MKLPWQKKGEEQLVRMRAAVMPITKKRNVEFGVSENNFTVNSVSTHFVNLQPLKAGQVAADVAPWQPGTINQGSYMLSAEEAAGRNLQVVKFDAPNWVSMLVVSHVSLYERHIDIPVWADESGIIKSVDVEAMLAELEPHRQRASQKWGQE